ncbi:glycerol-3-phosphate 1-O-acyltransferase PlsY [Dongshaea marina]|uniref:glycerol-3-phosphate 1-O-acyltransferase PlsY n=1 Tax=Dongshaea marina TaxID=2047966 RepID=UPI001F408F42|nr:glycerol-3-phosphate 1-O-acyltransferase PlsY [Dongshaea marina]
MICRRRKLPDPRSIGSHNPGATNMLRIGGREAALLVLLFDLLKGATPVLIAHELQLPPLEIGIVAVAACLGHMFPLYFGFKGGKGVATTLGVLIPISWGVTSLAACCWLLVLAIARYSSLASIISALTLPLYSYWLAPDFIIPLSLLSLLILVRHLPNIRRLIQGKEPRIGHKAP